LNEIYLVIWEFRVKEGYKAEFEQLYGPDGVWVELFRQGEGYLGTELLQDVAQPRRYLTLDRWHSRAAYEAFQQRWAEAYKELDRWCEGLTEQELIIGSMVHIEV
jgi:heme-degrading monooxygenase HmoA